MLQRFLGSKLPTLGNTWFNERPPTMGNPLLKSHFRVFDALTVVVLP